MKYFIIEGTLKNADLLNDDIMKEHMAYTQKAMDNGLILMSGLKKDMSGGIFTMKAESKEEIDSYLANEPFHLHNIQDYKVIEFTAHYFNEHISDWFKDK